MDARLAAFTERLRINGRRAVNDCDPENGVDPSPDCLAQTARACPFCSDVPDRLKHRCSCGCGQLLTP